MRNNHYFISHFPSFSTSYNEDCSGPDYEECKFTTPHLIPSSSSTSFTSCTFASLTANGNGGAIALENGNSGSLDILYCTFTECSSNVGVNINSLGGGAICINSPSQFYAYSSTFLECTTPSFGGGVFAQRDCEYSTVIQCNFLSCRGHHGGGLNVFFGPSSFTSSCRFICCTADYVGGGMYHDCMYEDRYLALTNSLFKGNTANCNGDRGGGGFEDYHQTPYKSHYYFSFFTGNQALSECGHDISIIVSGFPAENITRCFTTTSRKSFHYAGTYPVDWLPQGTLSFIIEAAGDQSASTIATFESSLAFLILHVIISHLRVLALSLLIQ